MRKKGWIVRLAGGRSILVSGPRHSEYAIVYDDGRVAYDHPERIPQHVKARANRYAAAIMGTL